jgi:hypothetical protein
MILPFRVFARPPSNNWIILPELKVVPPRLVILLRVLPLVPVPVFRIEVDPLLLPQDAAPYLVVRPFFSTASLFCLVPSLKKKKFSLAFGQHFNSFFNERGPKVMDFLFPHSKGGHVFLNIGHDNLAYQEKPFAVMLILRISFVYPSGILRCQVLWLCLVFVLWGKAVTFF